MRISEEKGGFSDVNPEIYLRNTATELPTRLQHFANIACVIRKANRPEGLRRKQDHYGGFGAICRWLGACFPRFEKEHGHEYPQDI